MSSSLGVKHSTLKSIASNLAGIVCFITFQNNSDAGTPCCIGPFVLSSNLRLQQRNKKIHTIFLLILQNVLPDLGIFVRFCTGTWAFAYTAAASLVWVSGGYCMEWAGVMHQIVSQTR
jgi:hypothetical protein